MTPSIEVTFDSVAPEASAAFWREALGYRQLYVREPYTVLGPPDGDARPRIVKTKAFQIKPMTPEEAILQMDLMGHDFFFFTNADTERAAVVYRRDDGDVGLIDQA